MSDLRPSQPCADRNLLFGILALQMEFIGRDALIAAMQAWVFDKNKDLGQILREHGQLTSERQQLLEALLQEHLKIHAQDPRQSLAALASALAVPEELNGIEDDQVQASLACLAAGSSACWEPLSPEQLERIDQACLAFEVAWKNLPTASPPPRLEDYLGDVPEPERSPFLGQLLAVEISYRRRRGEEPRTQEYRVRFPGLAPVELARVLGGASARTPEVTTTDGKMGGDGAATALRYRIVRHHAQGGLGQVYVAHDEELHREVALKEIQDRYADDPQSRARFLLEAEITGRLEHPGIVPVYGLGAYPDGRPYYAMRFVQGDSLKEAISRFHEAEAIHGRKPTDGERTLALRELLGRFVAMCNAVAYAHSRGVLHRDLKPGNVMLGKYGETLVVDWGLAKSVGRPESAESMDERTLRPSAGVGVAGTQAGSAVGTPAYMSPEQAAGRLEQLGPASDVYSLGATLYCLLTGKVPFKGAEAREVLQRVQRGEFLPPRRVNATVPPALEAICLKAMALAPAERYASPKQLADDIEHWLADEPVAAYREPWLKRAGR
jgi:serine/threonine protein kinase